MKNIFTAFLALIIGFAFSGCSPKATAPVVTTPDPKTEVTTPPATSNPCRTFDDLPGVDRETAESAFVLYKDQLKLNNYKAAFPIWRQAYSLAPGSNGRVKSHFDDGVLLYSKLIEETADSSKKKLLVDTIRMIQAKEKSVLVPMPITSDRKHLIITTTYPAWFLKLKSMRPSKNP